MENDAPITYICPHCGCVSSEVNASYSYGFDDYTECLFCIRCKMQMGYTNYYYDEDRKGCPDNGIFYYLPTT